MTIDCTYANYAINNPAGTFCVNGTMGAVNRVGSESPKGDGKWGQSDLGGNVTEWILDYFASPYPLPCDDCASLDVSSYRVIRSGGFNYTASNLRAAFRVNRYPSDRRIDLGFRCARTP
jgi:formylglycine-generating enzyme